VGCVTVGIDWSIFVILYPRIGSVALTNLISGTFSTAFNYLAHHRWTFKGDRHHAQSGIRYAVWLLFAYVLNTTLVKVFIVAGISSGISKLLAAVIQMPISYAVLKLIVFKTAEKKKDHQKFG
jgi:putative flippase GtrA